MLSKKRKFFIFLKQHNCFAKYFINFYKYTKWREYYGTPVKINKFFNYKRNFWFVSTAFKWDETKEGCRFWEKINIIWRTQYCYE